MKPRFKGSPCRKIGAFSIRRPIMSIAVAPQTTPTFAQIRATHAHLPCKCLTKRMQHPCLLLQGADNLPATLMPVMGHVRIGCLRSPSNLHQLAHPAPATARAVARQFRAMRMLPQGLLHMFPGMLLQCPLMFTQKF